MGAVSKILGRSFLFLTNLEDIYIFENGEVRGFKPFSRGDTLFGHFRPPSF